jgi:glutaminyl-tRNA synthetase
MPPGEEPTAPRDFIREIIEEDIRTGRFGGRVATRFPPEPNGYLHIGHAKSICLNFGIAEEYGGTCNLRMDDTNPVKEEQEYIDAIIRDVRWLGFRWPGAREDDPRAGVLFASDYFEQMYAWAVELIRKGKAYVCDLSPEEVRRTRGTLTAPGQESPYRNRSVEENLDLFERMRRGDFPDGSRTLRARIDMAHPNLNMRDPVLYRILHVPHPHAGERWCIYPMYDWAHGLEDSIEGITHSICTLEFENHRPLYDWLIEAINEGRTEDGSGPWGRRIHHPQQIEFARLNLTHTVMSKRRLLQLVREGHVRGWDDPRMPTLAGLRRRGVTPEAIRAFCREIGVARNDSVIDVVKLENAVRDDLNRRAPRVMAVLRPLKLVITNWPGGDAGIEWLEAVNNPEAPSMGTRRIPFSGVLYIERDDFRESPPPRYWRLFPGNEVRLRYGYLVRCTGLRKNEQTGEVEEVYCTYDPATRGGDAPDGRKVKSTIHWVSAAHALPCEVRLYDHLFSRPDPDEVQPAGSERADVDYGAEAARLAERGGDWRSNLNPHSLEVIWPAWVEPGVARAAVGERFQFERLGYFCIDPDSDPPDGRPVAESEGGATPPARRLIFNRIVSLKDTWAKIERRGKGQ